jgi:hypothetical protein
MPLIGWHGNAAPTASLATSTPTENSHPRIRKPCAPCSSIGPRANCIAAMLARSVQWGNGAARRARQERAGGPRAVLRVCLVAYQLAVGGMLGVGDVNQHRGRPVRRLLGCVILRRWLLWRWPPGAAPAALQPAGLLNNEQRAHTATCVRKSFIEDWLPSQAAVSRIFRNSPIGRTRTCGK